MIILHFFSAQTSQLFTSSRDKKAVVGSAVAEKVILGPNETKHLEGYTDGIIDYPTTTAILQESEDSHLPSFVDITPPVITHQHGCSKEVTVSLSKITTNTVVIPPKTILWEIQPVPEAEKVFGKIGVGSLRGRRLLSIFVLTKNMY